MSAYSYEVFIQEFAERTMANYNWFSGNSGNTVASTPRYEVTQLINSLFGLIIVPREKYKTIRERAGWQKPSLNKTSNYTLMREFINDCEAKGCLHNTYADHKKYPVNDFIRHLRNSLAHSGDCGLHFFPVQECSEIQGLIFYDIDKTTQEEFCLELSISEIYTLAQRIAAIYTEIESFKDAATKQTEYQKEVERVRSLLPKYNNGTQAT